MARDTVVLDTPSACAICVISIGLSFFGKGDMVSHLRYVFTFVIIVFCRIVNYFLRKASPCTALTPFVCTAFCVIYGTGSVSPARFRRCMDRAQTVPPVRHPAGAARFRGSSAGNAFAEIPQMPLRQRTHPPPARSAASCDGAHKILPVRSAKVCALHGAEVPRPRRAAAKP